MTTQERFVALSKWLGTRMDKGLCRCVVFRGGIGEKAKTPSRNDGNIKRNKVLPIRFEDFADTGYFG